MKKDGSEYEPDSSRVMLASLDRHLKEKDAAFSTAKDIEFPTAEKYQKEKQGFVDKVSLKGLTLQRGTHLSRRRAVMVQRSAWKPFYTVTDRDHMVFAYPALLVLGTVRSTTTCTLTILLSAPITTVLN